MILETSLCSTGSLYTSGYIKQLSIFYPVAERYCLSISHSCDCLWGENLVQNTMLNYDNTCSLYRFIKILYVKNSNLKRSTVDKKIFDFIWFSFVFSLLRWLIMFLIWLGHIQNEKQIGYSLCTPLKSSATRE